MMLELTNEDVKVLEEALAGVIEASSPKAKVEALLSTVDWSEMSNMKEWADKRLSQLEAELQAKKIAAMRLRLKLYEARTRPSEFTPPPPPPPEPKEHP